MSSVRSRKLKLLSHVTWPWREQLHFSILCCYLALYCCSTFGNIGLFDFSVSNIKGKFLRNNWQIWEQSLLSLLEMKWNCKMSRKSWLVCYSVSYLLEVLWIYNDTYLLLNLTLPNQESMHQMRLLFCLWIWLWGKNISGRR